jgi:hypothetical protein
VRVGPLVRAGAAVLDALSCSAGPIIGNSKNRRLGKLRHLLLTADPSFVRGQFSPKRRFDFRLHCDALNAILAGCGSSTSTLYTMGKSFTTPVASREIELRRFWMPLPLSDLDR